MARRDDDQDHAWMTAVLHTDLPLFQDAPKLRARLRQLPPFPFDFDDFDNRTADLRPAERLVVLALLKSYWRHGTLPADEDSLAAIGNVTRRRWRSMRPRLALAFDVDETGALRDFDLEEQWTLTLRKRENLTRAAEERWRRHRERLGATPPDGADRPLDGSATVTNPHAFAHAYADAFGASNADQDGPIADASRVVAFSREEGGRKVGSLEDEKEDLSSYLPSSPPSGAPIAHAYAGAIAHASAANAGDPEQANGLPATPPRSISNDDLAKRLREACGGKVEAAGLRPNGFQAIRRFLREGFDLETEVLPALAANIHTVDRLRHFGGDMVRRWVDDYREQRQARAVTPSASPPRRMVFVGVDSPAWQAHQDARRALGLAPLKAMQCREGYGRHLDTEYPNIGPSVDAAGAAPAKPPAVSAMPRPSGTEDRVKARSG